MSVDEIEKDDTPEIPEAARDAFIVDIDCHLSIKILDELYPYMDDEMIVDKLDRPMGDYQFSNVNWAPTWANEHGGIGVDSHGSAKTGEDILEMMNMMAVDVPIVTPGMNSMGLVNYPRMREEVCRAHNDYMLDKVTSVDDNIRGQAMIPIWDPEKAVEELDRIGDEDDFAAAYAWFSKYWRLGDPEYDQVFEKLVELDLPLSLHVEVTSMPDRATVEGSSMRTWTEAIAFAPLNHAIMNTVNMILTGVFDKYPDLDIVYQEGGYHWMPFVAHRLDEYYQMHPGDIELIERKYDAGEKYLDRMPSEYLFDNFHFSTQPMCLPDNPRHLEWLLEMEHAEDTMMFATDWPHSTHDPPTWVFENPALRKNDEMRESILHGTAEEVYRL